MYVTRFVDRVVELEFLRGYLSRFRYTPLYVYGPEGCGKTRLLRELILRAGELLGGDVIAIYIDALEDSDVRRAILASAPGYKFVEVSSIALDVIGRLLGEGVPVGSALARSIASLIDRFKDRVAGGTLRGRNIIIVVDDVTRALGLDRIEWYMKWLYEITQKLMEELEAKAVNVIASTSEGRSRRVVARHTYASIRLLWNMDRGAYRELFEELKPKEGVEFEDIWLTLGGNPRALVDLATRWDWRLEGLINEYERRLVEVYRDIARRGLTRELLEVLEDVDSPHESLNPRMGELEEILIDSNLVAYKNWITLTGGDVGVDKSIGIGRYYAWQIPAYKMILEKLARGSGQLKS